MRLLPVEEKRIEAVRRELETVELERVPDGSGTERGPETKRGWISGLTMTRLVEAGPLKAGRPPTIERNDLIDYPATATAIGRLMLDRGGTLFQVLVNRLDGGDLAKHRDGIPCEPIPERWHLPVVTNPEVEYWDEDSGSSHFPATGWSGPIPYWLLHSMRNGGTEPRVHLIVDLLIEPSECDDCP
jgi:hypothetical protein